MELKVELSEALSLIPEFSGENNEIEFVYFREGCKSALRILYGANKEDLLLTFLKNKLKGNALKRFSLKLKSYLSISVFLKDVKQVYASECDDPEFWISKMEDTYQKKNESMQEYSAKFEEMLQCAILGMEYSEVVKFGCINPKKSIDQKSNLERITISYFLDNMYSGQTKTGLEIYSGQLKSKNFIELVGVAIKFKEYELLGCEDFCTYHREFGCRCHFTLKCSEFLKCCDICLINEHLTKDCPEVLFKRNDKKAKLPNIDDDDWN